MPAPILPLVLLGAFALLAAGDKKKKKKPDELPGVPGAPGVPFPAEPGLGMEACPLDTAMPAPQQQATVALLSNPAIPPETLLAAAAIAEASGYPGAAQCLRAEAARRPGAQELPPGFDPTDPSTWPGALPGAGVPPAEPPPGAPTFPGEPPGGFPPGDIPTGPEIHIPGLGTFPIDPSLIPGLPPLGFPPTPPTPGREPGPPAAPTGPLTLPVDAMQFVIRFGDRPFGLATYYTGQGMRFHELEFLNPHLGPFTGGVPPYPAWQVGVPIIIPAAWAPLTKAMPPTGL